MKERELKAAYLTDRLGGEEEGVTLDVSVGVDHCDERGGGGVERRWRAKKGKSVE